VVRALDIYARAGRAWGFKAATPWRIVGRRAAEFRAVPDGKAPVDFVGHIAGGRAWYCELKSSSVPRIPLAVAGHPTVRPEQARRLRDAHESGAMALMLVAVVKAGVREWYALDWPAWCDAVAAAELAGASSVPRALLAEHGVLCVCRGGAPMFLDGER
jgi:hypothetical protein